MISRVVLTLGVVVVAIVLVSVLESRSETSSSSPQLAPDPHAETTPSLAVIQSELRGEREAPTGSRVESPEPEDLAASIEKSREQGSNLGGAVESRALHGKSISGDFVVKAGPDGERFYELVDEFLDLANPYGLAQRQKYRQFFLQRPELVDETISLELLECGATLCVAELRSLEGGELRSFMDEKTAWEAFDTRVIVVFPSSEDTTARVMFPHDPNVVGATLPSELSHQSLAD